MLLAGSARTIAAGIVASALLGLLLVAVLSIPSGKAHAAGDSDGDRCPDFSENDTNPAKGGSRDDENPWDYMNPTYDGRNRVDDTLAVINQYFNDDPPGQPDFHSPTDRTALVGQHSWNLGPPNGLQRVDDILNMVKQYFHDCIGYGHERTYANSWYVRLFHESLEDNRADMELRGYFDALYQNSPDYLCTDSLVVLDFSQPYHDSTDGYGTYTVDGKYLPNSSVVALASSYAKGWYSGASCTLLKLVVGANNYNFDLVVDGDGVVSGGGTPFGAGYEWAEVADDVQGYVDAHGYQGKVTVWSGSDFEQPAFGSDPEHDQHWDCFPDTNVFLNGYNSHSNGAYRVFANYGTAKEVSTWHFPDGEVVTPCWTYAQIRSASYRPLNFVTALPEIYTSSNPQDWKNVRVQGDMTFVGAMTTCTDSDPMSGAFCAIRPPNVDVWYRPLGAREDLSGKLWTSNLPPALFQFSTNIRFQ
jgi:hypothetical protein